MSFRIISVFLHAKQPNNKTIMSVTKFVRAQDILKEKGFKAPPFDTAAFQNAVVEFFRENDMSAKLTIRTMRFLDYKNAPIYTAAYTKNIWIANTQEFGTNTSTLTLNL